DAISSAGGQEGLRERLDFRAGGALGDLFAETVGFRSRQAGQNLHDAECIILIEHQAARIAQERLERWMQILHGLEAAATPDEFLLAADGGGARSNERQRLKIGRASCREGEVT